MVYGKKSLQSLSADYGYRASVSGAFDTRYQVVTYFALAGVSFSVLRDYAGFGSFIEFEDFRACFFAATA
jgi:hypothetical protein